VAASLSVLPSALPAYPNPAAALARLRGFRAGLHACCTRRADALVDLADALLSAQAPVASLPRLSLEPAHRRGWGSTYAALARGRIDAERLRDLLADYPLEGEQPVYAVDVTTWPRCDAECSPERGYYYHPSRHSAGQPIVAGWAFQWICQLGFARDSWTAPVDAARLHPLDDTDQHAARQVRTLLGRLPAGGPVPWFVFDAGYDSAQLSLDLADAPVAYWCGCGPTAASTPTRHHVRRALAAGRAATAPSSPSPTRPPGPPRPRTWPPTTSTAP
jgi:DDE superfamily endonuclease